MSTGLPDPLSMPSLRFHCVICGAAIQTSPDFEDDVVECHACSRHVPVPRPVKLPGRIGSMVPAFPPDVLELSVKFHCSHCAQKLRADARWEGRVVVCPQCGEKTGVPRWSTVPRWSRDAEPAPAATAVPTLSADEIDFLSAPAPKQPGAAA